MGEEIHCSVGTVVVFVGADWRESTLRDCHTNCTGVDNNGEKFTRRGRRWDEWPSSWEVGCRGCQRCWSTQAECIEQFLAKCCVLLVLFLTRWVVKKMQVLEFNCALYVCVSMMIYLHLKIYTRCSLCSVSVESFKLSCFICVNVKPFTKGQVITSDWVWNFFKPQRSPVAFEACI